MERNKKHMKPLKSRWFSCLYEIQILCVTCNTIKKCSIDLQNHCKRLANGKEPKTYETALTEIIFFVWNTNSINHLQPNPTVKTWPGKSLETACRWKGTQKIRNGLNRVVLVFLRNTSSISNLQPKQKVKHWPARSLQTACRWKRTQNIRNRSNRHSSPFCMKYKLD